MAQTLRKEVDPATSGPQRLDTSRFATATRKRLSAPAFRTFVSIAALWRLTEEERRLVLGYPSRSTYLNWLKLVREHRDFTLDVDTLTRISAVLGIHQALNVLHATEQEGVAWLRDPHAGGAFGGNAPLALVTSGSQDDLLMVRRFLAAACGGRYIEPNAIDFAFVPYEEADIVLR